MKELKICRNYADKFTVATSFEDYSAWAHEGLFPEVHLYYRVDTEAELIQELKNEEVLFAEDIDAIYYAGKNVTDKYLVYNKDRCCYQLKA